MNSNTSPQSSPTINENTNLSKKLVKKEAQIKQYLTSSFVIIIITFIFFFAGYLNYALSQLTKVLSSNSDYFNKLNSLHSIKLILLACIFPIIYGVVLMYFKNVFDNINLIDLFLGFLMYFSLIVIVPSIIFIFVPSFVEIFENTIGFWFISYFYKSKIENVMQNFKSKYFATTNNENNNPFYLINRSFLLKLFNLENIHKMTEQFTKFKDNNECDFYIDTPDPEPLLKPLLELVLTKNTVGYACWGILASSMAFMLTVNSKSINYSMVN
jgi:hypothetical protein